MLDIRLDHTAEVDIGHEIWPLSETIFTEYLLVYLRFSDRIFTSSSNYKWYKRESICLTFGLKVQPQSETGLGHDSVAHRNVLPSGWVIILLNNIIIK